MKTGEFEDLLCTITAGTVNKIIENTGWPEDEAIERFLQSKVYSFLEREETKVWHYSVTMLAQLFEAERSGNLIFPEGI